MAADNANKPTGPTRSADQVQADLTATRRRLVDSVESLIDTVHPNRVKQRQIDGVKQFANAELDNARGLVFNARGDLRTERVIAAGAAVAGAVVFLLIVRALVRRGRGG